MIRFFLKKSFYSGWDNLIAIIGLNIPLLGLAIGGYLLAGVVASIVPLSLAILCATAAAIGVVLVGISGCMAKVASYKSFRLSDVVSLIRESWGHGVLFGLLVAAAVLVVSVSIPFYFKIGGFVGYLLAAVLFWAAAIVALSLQWFLPIRSQLGGGFAVCLRKSFVIFFDNPGFSVFMFVHGALLLFVSFFIFFLVPGPSGVLLGHNEALRLRLYKYDWLERNGDRTPRDARRAIPWAELLEHDVETVGDRSFKDFIFPWKG
ncbi:MAG TPA: hypothetical protein PLU93_00840 [Treponemataceae bacterium]|jgi:hypothetical protein|nr:hypothetical protein [Treponemataceae bacterium]